MIFGFFLRKTSSPAPTFRGALYDWYLATNGGYWGVRAGLAGGRAVRLILNLRSWTVHVVNAMTIDVSPSSVVYSAFSLEGDLFNRLDLSYVVHDDMGTTSGAKNSYYLTDPSAREGDKRHSRFASLGAMRKENPRVNLDVRCTMSHGIECTVRNGCSNLVAVMIKLSLQRFGKEKDSRILPTFFSENYMTLRPGETTHVHTPIDEGSMLADCSTILVNTDGWNVQKSSVRVSRDSIAS